MLITTLTQIFLLTLVDQGSLWFLAQFKKEKITVLLSKAKHLLKCKAPEEKRTIANQ